MYRSPLQTAISHWRQIHAPGTQRLYPDQRSRLNASGVSVISSTVTTIGDRHDGASVEQRETNEAFAKPSQSLIWSADAPFDFPQHLAPKRKDLAAERRRDACSGYPASDVGASHFLWLRGCGATSPPLEEVGPPHVFEAASYGEQGVGARFRPAASRLFESVADDVLAGAFHDAGSDRQSARPIEIALHSIRVGLVVADAGRDGFGPAAAFSRAWNRSRMKVMSGPARISSQAVRIQGAPSDSTTSSSALNKALRHPNCYRRAAKSEARLRSCFKSSAKMFSLRIGRGKSIGFVINHPLNRKGRHHDLDA